MSIYEYDEEKHIQQERADAKEEGKIEGRNKACEIINRLNIILAEKGRTQDIINAAADKEYQKKLLEEFGLKL